MDNITHSLAGLVLASAATQLRARAIARQAGEDRYDPAFTTAAVFTGIVGANLPDIDVVWSAVLQAMGRYDALLSLLHHRGYTHTLLAALVGVPMLWALALLVRRAQSGSARRPVPADDSRRLLLLATVAILSHLCLDFTNDYGVHPFSPFVNAWTYGDTVFIIEPWLWIVAVPMLLRSSTRRLPQLLLWAVLLLGLSLSWIVPQVSSVAAMVLTIGAAAWVLLSRCVSPAVTAVPAIAAWVAVTLAFAAGTRAIRAGVHDAAAVRGADDVSMELADVLLSPSPANPFCARVIVVEHSADVYRLTTAWGSAVPGLVSAEWCSRAARTDTTRGARNLAMTRATRTPTPQVAWQWSWSAPRRELVALAQDNCRVSAWLRFARAPFWTKVAGDSVRVGDLRYDRDRVSVAAFTFAANPASCPVAVPPWVRPREGVLEGAQPL
ncbi:MAG: metal-dependent hydrolase [Gemmatimonadota bacterium]